MSLERILQDVQWLILSDAFTHQQKYREVDRSSDTFMQNFLDCREQFHQAKYKVIELIRDADFPRAAELEHLVTELDPLSKTFDDDSSAIKLLLIEVRRAGETAQDRSSEVKASKGQPGRKRIPSQVANDKLIAELWADFAELASREGKRPTRKQAAILWIESRDDMGFLTEGLEDINDFSRVANRIELACKRHKDSTTD